MKIKVLYIHNSLTTFVDIDRQILSSTFDVNELEYKSKLDIFRVRLLFKGLRECDVVVGWFASWHTFLPVIFARILKKKFILIAGGYDTAYIPEANYGNQLKLISRLITNFTIRFANEIICNSNFTKLETIRVAGISDSKVHVVYHGVPLKQLFQGNQKLKKQVLNVGNLSVENLKRKGILPFLQSGGLCKDWKFVQAGNVKTAEAFELAESVIGENTSILGYVSNEQLDKLYAESMYYIQPSLHEGFGMSVVESMQHGCVPIVSRMGALAEVIGDCGVLLNDISSESIALVVNNHDEETRQRLSDLAKKRVNKLYTVQQRSQKLIKIVTKATIL